MVVTYTSVWIRFLANGGPYAAELDGLLGRGMGSRATTSCMASC